MANRRILKADIGKSVEYHKRNGSHCRGIIESIRGGRMVVVTCDHPDDPIDFFTVYGKAYDGSKGKLIIVT